MELIILTDNKQRIGRYVETSVGGELVRSYIPTPLPPLPPVDLSPLQHLLDQANQAIGRLDGLATILPEEVFLYSYIRKEAVLSSQIEGTQSSLSELLIYESGAKAGVPLTDVGEVSNYVAALNHGMRRIADGFPLSLRLIREMHGILLAGTRGSHQEPGKFRRSQNWIGGTRPGNAIFVPPPADSVADCMGQLELFLHEDDPSLPMLLKAALVHVQFETIHPFLDGNGRIGRLLITFLLAVGGALRKPLLYLSLYLKTHRDQYYELLTAVRSRGDWESWVEFFLTAIIDTCRQAISTAQRLMALIDSDRRKIESTPRSAGTILRVFEFMQRKPAFTIAEVARVTGLTFATVSKGVKRLEKLAILSNTAGQKRNRVFSYTGYIAILSEGTEPLSL